MSSLPTIPNDRREFEEYFASLRGHTWTLEDLIHAVVVIMRSDLALRERNRRAALVVDSARLSEAAMADAAQQILSMGVSLPQALVRAAQYRHASTLSAQFADQPWQPSASPVPQFESAESSTGVGAAGQTEYRGTVLLLGSATEHNANRSLLENNGKPIKAQRFEDGAWFDGVRDEQFCGVVIGASWWHKIVPSKHEEELTRILGYSSIPWVRVDIATISSSAASAFPEIARRAYGGERSHALLCHGSGCDITSSDLESILRVCEVLETADRVGVHPEELSADDAHLLRAAVIGHVREARGVLLSFDLMGIRFIPGGLSGACVAIVTPNDGGMPLVVKLGTVATMRAEVQNYSYVARWEGGLFRPQLYFHGERALLLVPLVDDGDGGAARTLGDKIQELVYNDLHSLPDTEVLRSAISCVSRALRRIAKLNAEDFAAGQPRNLAQLLVRELGARRILAGSHDVGTALAKAQSQIAKFDGRVTVHGDLHLGNVLVRGETPTFIDFGQAGGGHPVQDIAKLDLQIWFHAFRMTEDLTITAELVAKCFSGASAEELIAACPSAQLFSSSRLCVNSSVIARSEALRVVERIGGSISDVAAMYIVYAVYELLVSPASTPLALAFISALAKFVDA